MERDSTTLNPYTDPERHNTFRHRQRDGQTDGRTDDSIMPVADHTT